MLTLDIYEVSAPGCSGPTGIFSVTINPSPAPVVVSGNTLVCDSLPQLYTLTANAGSTYTWTVMNDLHDTLNATSDTMTVSWVSPGSGQINVFETNSFSCNSDTALVNVSIYTLPHAFIVSDSDSICSNVPFQVLASASTPNIKWYTDGGGTFSNDSITSPVYIPAPTDSGYTHLSMVVSNATCANDTGRVLLYISSAPIVTITGPPGPICYGSFDSLRATGGGSYLWTPGGIPAQVIGIRPTNTTTYTVTVTNINGCVTRDSITVNVIPPGMADAGQDTVLCVGDPVSLNGSQQNGTGILWSTLGDGTFVPDNTTAQAVYQPGVNDTTNGSATLVLSTTGACLDGTDTMVVSLTCIPLLLSAMIRL